MHQLALALLLLLLVLLAGWLCPMPGCLHAMVLLAATA
jgi:hypothetical protein